MNKQNGGTNMNQTRNTQRKGLSVKMITKIALLSALAGVLMLFEAPLWFAPSFYKLDLSELAVLMGGLTMGPMAAALIELMKILLNFVLNGTITGGVGELGNFIVGCAFVVPAAFVYQKWHNKIGMLAGMAAGIVCLVALGSVVNYFVLLPVYAVVYGQPLEAFIAMGHALNPAIVDLQTFILYAVAPFNLLKGVVISILTGLLYNRIGKHLEK
jgi:riboflavin transporter FmnP